MARHRSSRSGIVRRGTGSQPRATLSPRARIQIVYTALDLIETLYVHLPQKRSMYAVNPIQRLKLLRRRCEQRMPVVAEREFFNELISIFTQLRDLHTGLSYRNLSGAVTRSSLFDWNDTRQLPAKKPTL